MYRFQSLLLTGTAATPQFATTITDTLTGSFIWLGAILNAVAAVAILTTSMGAAISKRQREEGKTEMLKILAYVVVGANAAAIVAFATSIK